MTTQILKKRRAIAGPALIIVCILHTAVGVLASAPALGEALANGWFGAVSGELEVALWFLMTGFFGLVAGLAMTALERAGRMPWSVSIGLLVISLIGLSAAPVSGFMFMFVVAIIAIVQSAGQKRRRSAESRGDGQAVDSVGLSASEPASLEQSSHRGRAQA